jgi:hypothetical protein
MCSSISSAKPLASVIELKSFPLIFTQGRFQNACFVAGQTFGIPTFMWYGMRQVCGEQISGTEFVH